jgi:SAM-dependent methyltransferase
MAMWKISLLRELEYSLLEKLTLNGKILDLWWSRKSWYQELIQGNHEFVVVNISEEYWYDLNFDIQEKFPLKDESFDAVIAINVLEHIYKFQNVVKESYRVLKKWGKLAFITPFMFQVHGSPDDYFRYTKSALQNIFEDVWFQKSHIKIEEIWTWIFHIFYQMICWVAPTKAFKYLLKKFCVWIDSLFMRISKKYKHSVKNYCLWYFTEIIK